MDNTYMFALGAGVLFVRYVHLCFIRYSNCNDVFSTRVWYEQAFDSQEHEDLTRASMVNDSGESLKRLFRLGTPISDRCQLIRPCFTWVIDKNCSLLPF
jgi:hypothetical protein